MCGCGSTKTGTALLPTPCDDPTTPGLERARFYPRMLVGPADLTQDQIYFREKSRRHNRMLHGWGVVCGAEVSGVRNKPCEVVVHPGYLLGPYGDEIVIPREVPLDICRMGSGEVLGCCPDDYDPWCSDVRASCNQGEKYLAIRYAECMAIPVRASGGGCGCGCDESNCEYSRIRDSYGFHLLDRLPESYRRSPDPSVIAVDPCPLPGSIRRCPSCPDDPWVILASFTLTPRCEISGGIDCIKYRRYVRVDTRPIFCSRMVQPPHWRPDLPLVNVGVLRTIVDLRAADRGDSPIATMRLETTAGEPVMMPIYAGMVPDAATTAANYLEVFGDRTLFDPHLGTTFTVRDLFESAGVPGTASIRGASGLMGVLEGRPYRIPEVENQRAAIADLIGEPGLTRLNEEGLPLHDTPELPAAMVARGEIPERVAKSLERLTIGSLAKLTRAQFVNRVVKGVSAEEKKYLSAAAEAVWDKARDAVNVSRPLPKP